MTKSNLELTFFYVACLWILAYLIAGCAAPNRPIRIDFSCVSQAEGDKLLTSCGDEQSWREYYEKKMREQGI